MESDNILAVNFPNFITVLVMAIVGTTLLALVQKGVKQRQAATGRASAAAS